MTLSIIDRKADVLKMSIVTIAIAIIVVVYFCHISVKIFLNFICFIIKNRLYYLDCASKLLQIKLMNLNCLESLFLLLLLCLLVCGDFFLISSVTLLVVLLFLLALDCFLCCLNRSDLLLIEKLINLDCIKLLLLAPLLLVAPSRSFCPMPRCSIYVCYTFA